LRKLSDALRPALVKRGKQRLLAGLKRSQPAGNDNYVALHLLGKPLQPAAKKQVLPAAENVCHGLLMHTRWDNARK